MSLLVEIDGRKAPAGTLLDVGFQARDMPGGTIVHIAVKTSDGVCGVELHQGVDEDQFIQWLNQQYATAGFVTVYPHNPRRRHLRVVV